MAGSEASIPNCLNCGYLLHGLTAARCPECGHAVDPRELLTPWERSEVGGVIKRTIKTIWIACAHPERFFARFNQRRNQPIQNAGAFMMACVIASLAIHFGGIALMHLTNLVRFTIKSGDISQALRIVGTGIYYGLWTDWFFPSQEVLGWLTAIFLTGGAVCFILKRKAIGSLRLIDITAAFAPILAGAALIHVLGIYLVSLYFDALVVWGSRITAWTPVVLFALMTWHCSRRLINTTSINAVGLSVLALAISYYSGWPIRVILNPVLQAIVSNS